MHSYLEACCSENFNKIYFHTLCINTYSQVVIALVRLCKCVGLSELLLFSFAIVPNSHGLAHLIFSLYLHMVMALEERKHVGSKKTCRLTLPIS